MKRLAMLAFGLLTNNLAEALVQSPIDCHILYHDAKSIEIKWNAYSGKSYIVQHTTNLAGSWSSTPTIVATSNALAHSFPIIAEAQFFKVVKIDTEGPEMVGVSPSDGAIAVDRQSSIRVLLSDLNSINTNSIVFKVGTNAPMTLADPRLSFVDGRISYTPGTNDLLGNHGDIVTNKLIVADTLGNESTNTWSFRIALETILSTNIVVIGGGHGQNSSLILISTNGDYFCFRYIGQSSGLGNGMQLVKADLRSGFTRTVVSFTEYATSNTVVVLTKPTKLAELLKQGSLQGVSFSEISDGSPRRTGGFDANLGFHYNYNLAQTLYEDGNLVVGLLPSSKLDLNAALDLNGNFSWFKLTSFEAMLSGAVDLTLEGYVHANGAYDRSGEKGLVSPVHRFYGAMIGPVPVWLEIVFEINAGYDLHLEGSGGYTNGFRAVKAIRMGRRWDTVKGWTRIWENPELGFTVLGPKWQVEGSGTLRVWLQPKVTVLAYSLAGAWADLKPYAELEGSLQLSPYELDLNLYGGLSSTLGLDLRVWDDSWGELPDVTFDLIPRTLLWGYSSAASSAPRIALASQPQSVPVGGTAVFTVQAEGARPLGYMWQRNGLNLTEGGRVTGTRSSTLRITGVQTGDAGNYRVVASNPNGIAISQNVALTIVPEIALSGMALISAGAFVMGDNSGEGAPPEAPAHTVYLDKFLIDTFEVTEELWNQVFEWALNHGYSFDNQGSWYRGTNYSKGPRYPVHTVSWYDAVKWCNARSQSQGLVPCYYFIDSGVNRVYTRGQLTPNVMWGANGYRLPTEAEWEKAARGGLNGRRFSWGTMISHQNANYVGSADYLYDVASPGTHPAFSNGQLPFTSPAGSFQPNEYGLYDMAGNVWEYCWDWFDETWYSNPAALQRNTRGPTGPLIFRTMRGGAWDAGALNLRCAFRGGHHPAEATWSPETFGHYGFRCVRVPD